MSISIDLISRALYLRSKGENVLIARINKWVEENANHPTVGFTVENKKYHWKEISSIQFKDIIDEDKTDWFLVYSENLEFILIAKKYYLFKNLIEKNTGSHISTLWILKSNIDSIKIDQTPVLIYTPYHFDLSTSHLAYQFKQLILKLKDPKVKLTQIPSYAAPGWKSERIR